MKFRVILNEKTRFLHITTFTDELPENNKELFSVESDFTDKFSTANCLTMCRCFCLGVLQGNTIGPINNSPKDFENPFKGVIWRKQREHIGQVLEKDADSHIERLNASTGAKWRKDYSSLLITINNDNTETHSAALHKGYCWVVIE